MNKPKFARFPGYLLYSLMAAGMIVGLTLILAGCGGASAAANPPGGGTNAYSAPLMISSGDAPLSNVITARVTISALTLTSTAGQQIQALPKPQTIELANLAGIREPLHLTKLPGGAYDAATVTVTAAHIVYIDPSSGEAVAADATIQNGTVSVALNPSLTVDSDDGLQLHLDFNLASSISMSNGAVIFAPALRAAWGRVKDEPDADRRVLVIGTVTAIATTSITVQAGDSNAIWAFVIDSNTDFSGSLSPAAIQAGSVVQVLGRVKADGSLTALRIGSLLDGQVENQSELGALGVAVSVARDSSGAATSFEYVVRYGFGSGTYGDILDVSLDSATIYSTGGEAQEAGVAAGAFTNAEIFPGQAAWLLGVENGNNNVGAQEVRLAGEGAHGALAAQVQAVVSNIAGAQPSFNFPVQLPAWSYLTRLAGITTLEVYANSNCEFGDGLSAATFASTAVGTKLTVNGFLISNNGQYTFYARRIELSQ